MSQRGPATKICSYIVWCVLVWLVSSCASTKIAPVAGANFIPEQDEQQLWDRSTKLDQEVDHRHLCYDDAELQQYLDGVKVRILTELDAPGAGVRVRVLKDPFLNAFALPNGTVYLHAGILANMENEAQLATLLGHELTHFVRRHSLKQTRTADNRRTAAQVVVGILAIAAAGASGDANAARLFADLVGPAADVLLTAQVQGYSRDLEREADEKSFDALLRAGYDPREAPKVFLLLQKEQQEAGLDEPYFFGSHPLLAERIAYHSERVNQWDARAEASLRLGAKEFNDAVSSLLLENARLDLRIGRTTRARAAVERHVAHRPTSAPGYFLLGEIHRRVDAIDAALTAYLRAAELDANYADPRRELGLLYREQGRASAARTELERYLVLAGDAPDRAIIQGYLSDLGTDGGVH